MSMQRMMFITHPSPLVKGRRSKPHPVPLLARGGVEIPSFTRRGRGGFTYAVLIMTVLK